MAIFTVDSTSYALQGEPVLRSVDLASYRRRFSGKMSSSTRGPATAQAWAITTDILTTAEADALEGTLVAPGTVAIGGDVIGTLTCRAENVVREDGPLDDMAVISCDLLEVTP